MLLFLASLAMGFGALFVAWFIMRGRAETWPPPGTPPLPHGLWLSTALILCSSGTMQWALSSVRRGRLSTLRWTMLATTLLAVGFVISQVANWGLAVAAEMPPGLNMFTVLFYLLTGLHALHIVGGLVPLSIVTAKTFAGAYTATHHAGVGYCAMYWHFVDAVWVLMFVLIVLVS